jgi:hypothetical protein
VLAGFAQLMPDRVALVTADPYHPRTLRVTVSGVAPSGPPPDGPAPEKPARPMHVQVRVQKRTPEGDELGWQDAPGGRSCGDAILRRSGPLPAESGTLDGCRNVCRRADTRHVPPASRGVRVYLRELHGRTTCSRAFDLRRAFEVDTALLGA